MATIDIGPTTGAALSPRLYMQFMEPLGAADGSVEAGWDFGLDRWRPDLLETIRDLAPGAIRWGGILTSYWKWREGIGPPDKRTPMPNYLWGGVEANRIGVHEILGLCEAVRAEPLIGINFAADGRPSYIAPPRGRSRAGTAEEAADLVRYCNDPDHAERRANGRGEPWGIKLWQIGNETSYPPAGQRFDREQNAATFRRFATAMRATDPDIALIGWGDQEEKSGAWWAETLLREAGELVDFVALHMMHQRPAREDTLLRGRRYRQDHARAWAELDEIYRTVASKLAEAREVVRHHSPSARLAITEGHLSLQPHNKCPLLSEWLSGLYHARIMNLYERNADMLEVSTLSAPRESPYLLPSGLIARLYRRHGGGRLVGVRSDDPYLDVAASGGDGRFYLHVVNTDLSSPHRVELRAAGSTVRGGAAHVIAPGSLEAYADGTGDVLAWTFPAASVSALELEVAPAGD